ncbi:MAG: hypothetical protein ABEJ78_04865 [Haloferacaceae archaeon]
MSARPSLTKRIATVSGFLAVFVSLVGATSLLRVSTFVTRRVSQWRDVAVRTVRETGIADAARVAGGPSVLPPRPTALFVISALAAFAVWTDRRWLVWSLAVTSTAVAGLGSVSFGAYFALPALLLFVTGLFLSFTPRRDVADQPDVTF